MAKKEDLEAIAERLFEERRLDLTLRDYSYMAPGLEGEPVSGHSYQVAFAAFCLAGIAKAGGRDVDAGRTALLALFHDSPETRTGDIPRTHMRYVTVDNGKAIAEKFSGWSPGEDFKELLAGFEAQETPESQLAADADVIAQLVVIRILGVRGITGTEERFEKNFERLKTEEGRALAEVLKTTSHMAWWYKARGFDQPKTGK